MLSKQVAKDRIRQKAAAVVILAGSVSGFTVGQNLHVDGGNMEHSAF